MPSKDGGTFELLVPLDASRVKDFRPDRSVKVVASGREGCLRETTVRFDPNGRVVATLTFDRIPGTLRVMVVPADVRMSQLADPLPLCAHVREHQWHGKRSLTVPPIVISSFYWWWWLAPPVGRPAPPSPHDP